MLPTIDRKINLRIPEFLGPILREKHWLSVALLQIAKHLLLSRYFFLRVNYISSSLRGDRIGFLLKVLGRSFWIKKAGTALVEAGLMIDN